MSHVLRSKSTVAHPSGATRSGLMGKGTPGRHRFVISMQPILCSVTWYSLKSGPTTRLCGMGVQAVRHSITAQKAAFIAVLGPRAQRRTERPHALRDDLTAGRLQHGPV